MVARLTLTEKETLLKEERKRRVIVRKQQVRIQADEYSKQIRQALRTKSDNIAQSIRTEIRSEVSSRLTTDSPPQIVRRSPRLTPRSVIVIQRTTPHRKTPRRQNQVIQKTTPSRKTPRRQNHLLKQAIDRGAEALKKLQKARRSDELRKLALLNKRKAVMRHFNQVSKEGAERVPIMQ